MFKTNAIICSLMIISTCIHAEGDPAAGEAKTAICVACHGNGGISTTPVWPNLAGQNVEYLRKQLHDFKDEIRTDPQMSPMTISLTDQDVEDLAAYFASLEPAMGEASPENIATGEKIYRAGNPKTGLSACTGCHGPGGKGNPAATYPALGGQHADYIASTLKKFKSETRSNDVKSVMRIIAGKMTNEEIEAVSNYIQGLY